VVGSWTALAELSAALSVAGVAVCRLGTELLRRIPDPDSLAAAEEVRSPEAADAVRRAVGQAFDAWLREAATQGGPLAVQDLELAVAERVELARLTELGRPVLVLAPGLAARHLARLYATGPHDGVPLPPAIAPRDATWVLSSDSEERIPAPTAREDPETA